MGNKSNTFVKYALANIRVLNMDMAPSGNFRDRDAESSDMDVEWNIRTLLKPTSI